MPRIIITIIIATITVTSALLLATTLSRATSWAAGEEPLSAPPKPLAGSLILHGSAQPDERILESFHWMAGRENSRIVVIDDGEATTAESIQYWTKSGVRSLKRISIANREDANESSKLAPLLDATGVWIAGADTAMFADILCGTALGQSVAGVLERGRIVAGRGAGAEVLGHRWIKNDGEQDVELREGLGLFPNAIVEPALTEATEAVLARAIGLAPGVVGYGLPESSALAMRDRVAKIVGDPVTVLLSPSETRPLRKDVLPKSVDLIAMARAAIARSEPPFPAAKLPTPHVANGALVIVGGGHTKEIVARFIELAGGANEARIVVIPTALGRHAARRPGSAKFLRNAGVRSIEVIHAAAPEEAARPEFLDPLRSATGIWFTGGRQWRLVDSYAGTPAEQLMYEVLERGGVIGGSSAGATIQAEYLVRGNPLGNEEMMAEGYERGLGFLKGVAIDQHFAQRSRFADMSNVKRVFPQLIGLGIDEKTAAVVQKSTLTVIGKNKVAIFDRDDPSAPGPEYKSLSAGQVYDFTTRRIIDAIAD